MSAFLASSAFFSLLLSLAAYGIGCLARKKLGLAICNPLLIAVAIVIAALQVLDVSYDDYLQSAGHISYLLTPATVCLAIPLYEKTHLLRRHWKALLAGITGGSLAGLAGIYGLSLLFGFQRQIYVTLLPKSITTAIGMDVSAELGGYVSVTVAVIILTGVLGSVIAEGVCRRFRITDPGARGVALGTSAHAIGTAKAMELGEVEGAMSSLAIVVAGLFTVAAAPLFGGLPL